MVQRTEPSQLSVRSRNISVSVAHLLVLVAIAFCSKTWALSAVAPGSAGAKLEFHGSASSLSLDQKAELDRAAAEMATHCGSDWASRSWLNINYSLPPKSPPRRDYQLIGERAERIRDYMKRFNLKRTSVQIEMLESPSNNLANRGRDHWVSVSMMCSL
jgi:hypothetical protein